MRAILLAIAGLLLAATPAAAQRLPSPADYDAPPAGWRTAPADVLRAVAARPEVRRARAGHELTYGRVYFKSRAKRRWQVSFFTPPEESGGRTRELSQTVVDDRTGRVLESWTGYKVEWTMARGYAGAFGRVANALWIWLPLCALFVLPFARPPLRLLHLDLAVLLAFSVSYAFFNAARIDVSVPLVYPLLAYLLARMLGIAFSRARGREPPPVRLTLPVAALGLGAVFLLGVRCGLNVVGSNVIDVGYAGVIGADRAGSGEAIYDNFPADNYRGDTYGPVLYYAYVPFEALLPWRGGWDDLPAAHAAAVTFDLLTAGALWLLGRQLRGPVLGALFAYLWAAFPFTLLVANANANDGLVALLVTAAMLALAATGAARSGDRRRGADEVRAGRARAAAGDLPRRGGVPRPARRRDGGGRFRGARRRSRSRRSRSPTAASACSTSGRSGSRSSATRPSRSGGCMACPPARVALFTALGFAVVVAFVPRRRDPVAVAALGAAALIALQLALEHWFYLYVVWFLPLVFVALLAGRRIVSIDAARDGREPSSVRMTTAISHGSSSEES